MKKDAFVHAEFSEMSIKFSRPILQHFIKKMIDHHYLLTWRYSFKKIHLVVELDHITYELPFVRHPTYLTLQASTIQIHEEPFAQLLEEIIQDEKGNGIVKRKTTGPLIITFYHLGEITYIIEVDGSEKKMTNRHGSLIHLKDDYHSLKPEIVYNMVNLEIDYVLMELHEALLTADQPLIESHKKKLKKLLSRRNKVKQLL